MAKTRIDYRAKALKRRNRFAYITGISGLLLITFSYYFYQVFYTPNVETKGKPTYVVVRRGETAKAVLDSIEATGVIVDKLSLRFVAKVMKYEQLVKPGRYELKEG